MVQDEPLEEFEIEVEGLVEDLLFDPDQWLLKSVSVVSLIFQDSLTRDFVFGPNPVTDALRIRFFNGTHIDKIRITNMNGQEVFRRMDVENPVTIDLSSLADGSYMLELSRSSGSYLEQIVKISANTR